MDEKGLPKKGSIGRPKRSEAGAKQIELMERRKRVAELHTQGLYWTAIGLELGISDTQAANDWKAWMAECREYPGREAQREFARASYESDLEADRQRPRTVRRRCCSGVGGNGRRDAVSRENGWPVVYEASDGRVPVDDVPVINVADVEHVQVVGPSIFIEKPGPLGCWSVVVRSKPRGCSHVSTVTVVTIDDMDRESANHAAETILRAAYNQAPRW